MSNRERVKSFDPNIFNLDKEVRNWQEISSGAFTRRGKKENSYKPNQDAVLIHGIGQNQLVLVAADGLGSYLNAEFASQRATEVVADSLSQSASNIDDSHQQRIANAINEANQAIFRSGYKTATTLLLALLVRERVHHKDTWNMYYASIGDGIIGVHEGGKKIPQRVAGAVGNGVYVDEVIGYDANLSFRAHNVQARELKSGTTVYLFTDGVSEAITETERLRKFLNQDKTPQQKAEMIVNYTLADDTPLGNRSYYDDSSAVIVKIEDFPSLQQLTMPSL